MMPLNASVVYSLPCWLHRQTGFLILFRIGRFPNCPGFVVSIALFRLSLLATVTSRYFSNSPSLLTVILSSRCNIDCYYLVCWLLPKDQHSCLRLLCYTPALITKHTRHTLFQARKSRNTRALVVLCASLKPRPTSFSRLC